MGRNPSASRRDVLRGGTAALVGVGGLASSGTAIAQNRQVHADLNSSLAKLEAVWEHNGEQKLNQWSQQLRSEAIDAVNPIPGVEDLLPRGGDKILTLVDQMRVTTGFFEQTRWIQARMEYRETWEQIDDYDQTLQNQYYTKLGYGVGNSLVNGTPQNPGHPYLALYEALQRGTFEAYHGNIAYETLETRGEYVHAVLTQKLLGRLPERNKYERALHANLEALDQLALATRNLARKHI